MELLCQHYFFLRPGDGGRASSFSMYGGLKFYPFHCSWWQHAANLASYEQQDAHEFFISMLDAIHEREEPSQSISRNGGNSFAGKDIWKSFLAVSVVPHRRAQMHYKIKKVGF